MLIKKTTTINEIIKNNSKRQVLIKHGIRCIGCHANYENSLEKEAKESGLNNEMLEELIKELNEN